MCPVRPYFSAIGLAASTGKLKCLHVWNEKFDSRDTSDLTPLSTLVSLRKLKLYPHSMDLRPLSNLINLEKLTLPEMPQLDLGFLASLVNLRHLTVGLGVSCDLSPIRNLVNLKQPVIYVWNEYTSGVAKPRLDRLSEEGLNTLLEPLANMMLTTSVDVVEAQSTARQGVFTFELIRQSRK